LAVSRRELPEGYEPLVSDAGADQRAWKRGYGCEVTRTHFDEKRKMVSGLVLAQAWCKLGRRKIVSLKCNYAVAYDIEGETDESAARQFVERVGKFAVYPYFRTHFAELTTQAGIMMSPLPVMKEGRRTVPVTRSDEADV
jgi:hypothetical protein